MDGGDPAVDSQQLDSFSVAFPLPYRIAVIVILGACFLSTLHALHLTLCRFS
jgi:hypothetical protein